MTDDADVLDALALIEHAQSALQAILRTVELSRLRERPVNGQWSPMENVRHLIFAEQHHFGPYLPRGFRWSSAGVPPPNRTGERRLSPVGSDPTTTVDDVFLAWEKVHSVVRTLCTAIPRETAARSLEGNLHHLTTHARVIEDLLAR